MRSPRIFALYLPAYHPIPENDEQWGAGFTEWHNVTSSRPRFKNHYQPHVPADLGYYDLRLPETRSRQAALARHYGIAGFIYYHYWFGGRTLLETPLNEVFKTQEPDFPFAICWANEPGRVAGTAGHRKSSCLKSIPPRMTVSTSKRYSLCSPTNGTYAWKASHSC